MTFFKTVQNEIFAIGTPEVIYIDEDETKIMWIEAGQLMSFSPEIESTWATFLRRLTTDGRAREITSQEAHDLLKTQYEQ